MFSKFHLVSSIAFTLLVMPLCLCAGLERGDMVRTINVVIDGPSSKQVDMESIYRRLKTKAGAPFSQDDFDEDLKSLVRDFNEVDPSLDFTDEGVVVELRLQPRPVIGRIVFRGNDHMETATLLKELGVNPADIFDRQKFIKGFNELKTYYVKKGYFESELTYHTEFIPTTQQLDVFIDVKEGRAGRVGDIRFMGFSRQEEKVLSSMLLTKKFNFISSWLTGDGTYRKEMVEQDEFVILNYIQNLGYADAQVHIEARESKKRPNRLNIAIVLDRGPKFTFGCVTFEGNSLIPDEEIQSLIGVREGEPFSPDAIRDSVKVLSDLYGKRGHIDAYVSYTPRLCGEGDQYDLHFVIHEGRLYHVGMIKVFGNFATHCEVILRESLLFPGDVFNAVKLQQTEIRLRNMGYFSNVNIYAVKPDDDLGYDDGYRDIHIEVEECSTGDFSFSFGMSTAESIFGSLSFTEKNFCISGVSNLLCDGYCAVRGAGEYFNARLVIGSKQRSLNLSWTEPYYRCTPWAVGVDFEHVANMAYSESLTLYSSQLALHANYPLNAFLRYGCHWRLKYSDDEARARATLQQREYETKDGFTDAIGMGLCYDSTNHPAMPNQGFRSRADLELVGLATSRHYVNFNYLNSWYYPLPFCSIFRLRADARLAFPIWGTEADDVSLGDRFFLGGETTIRGFHAYHCGELDSQGQPRGGLTSLLASAEVLMPLFSRVDAFLFYDAGYLTMTPLGYAEVPQMEKPSSVDSTNDHRSFEHAHHSYGYGLRLKVMENGPPIIVGWGYPIEQEDKFGDRIKRFFVTFGGRF